METTLVNELTKAQAKALAILKAGNFKQTRYGQIVTGANMVALIGLRNKGFICVKDIFAGGIVSADLKVLK